FPTHGGGSFCGTGGRSGHETTLGQERKTNPFFLTTEVMPFLARALNQHRYPTYYRDMGAINRGGATLIGKSVPPLAALTADEVARMMDDGAAVVDVRIGRDYDRGHIPGSYNVGIDGPVSAWVGWLIARGRPLILVGGGDKELHKAQRQLLRIGYDTIAGGLDGGIEAWLSSGREVSTFETVDVEDMAQWVLSAEPMTVVDTRDGHEGVAGHVPAAGSRRTRPSPALLGPPDLLRRPLAAPFSRHVLVVGMVHRVLRCVQLAKVQHVESGPAQDLEQLRVADVELGARPDLVVRPVEAVHSLQRPHELRPDPFGVGRAHHLEVRRAHEDQLAARAQKARGLWDPQVRIAPQRG